MKDERRLWNEIAAGDTVTVWCHDGHGQGGVVTAITPDTIDLRCGTAEVERSFTRSEAHHVTVEVPHDADECLEYDPDRCKGAVELMAVGRGNAFPRCQYHRDRRMDSYENSIERYADSDVPPDWFDPANAGEHWDSDY